MLGEMVIEYIVLKVHGTVSLCIVLTSDMQQTD